MWSQKTNGLANQQKLKKNKNNKQIEIKTKNNRTKINMLLDSQYNLLSSLIKV